MARRSKQKKVRRKLGVSEAADHLLILIEELKPLSDEATDYRSRALMLLDLCTDQLCRAIEANARAKAKRKVKCSTDNTAKLFSNATAAAACSTLIQKTSTKLAEPLTKIDGKAGGLGTSGSTTAIAVKTEYQKSTRRKTTSNKGSPPATTTKPAGHPSPRSHKRRSTVEAIAHAR